MRAVPVLGQQLAEAPAHLGGGLVGEGDREDLVRADAEVADEVGDAVREHACLTAAGSCEHEERTVGGEHSFELRGVQRTEVDSHKTGSLPLAPPNRTARARACAILA